MSKSSGGFFSSLLDFLSSIFGGKPKPPPVSTTVPADNANEPAQSITSKVLLLIYEPVMDPATGKKLSEQMNWNRPDDLANAYSGDLLQVSGGKARYQIADRVELNEFPAMLDGFRYTPSSFMDVMRGTTPPHSPAQVDYQAILTRFNILQRVTNSQIDEVWVFAFPHAGFYESAMGGAGAYWCNAPALKDTQSCPRKFITMGFSYERGVGEMLESFSHRTESIMTKTFERLSGDANLWQRFTRYDKIAPGKAAIGTVHYAPNSERDYDWNNQRMVPSECYDWFNFPRFRGDIRQVNASEWGNGEIRAHHNWWLEHLPKVAGRINGVHNNWWQYVIDPNRI
jgi:hypothetical protein